MRHFHPNEIPEKVKIWKDRADRAHRYITDKGLWQEYQKWMAKEQKVQEK